MPALPDEPLVHRSWLTRGIFSPSPTWGLTVPPVWLDTPVTFTRNGPRTEVGGSWEGGTAQSFSSVMAHVEMEESVLLANDIGVPSVGFLKKRHYLVIIPLPADTDDIPKLNDRVSFTDPKGEQFNLAIEGVMVSENDADHLEISTDWWE